MPTPCGKASYQILPNNLIEVNGKVPTSDAIRPKLEKLWGMYGREVAAACSKHGIPKAWFMGIMLKESGGNADACSPCNAQLCPALYKHGLCATQACCAYGLMQFIDMTAREYGTTGPALRGNASLAIEIAARFIADKRTKYGNDLVKIAASYNCGSPKCTGEGTFGYCGQNDYSMGVLTASNTFQLMGLGSDFSLNMEPIFWYGAALGAYLAWRKVRKAQRLPVPV
jgi:hypothetical protein